MSLRFAKQNRVRHSARLAIPRAARFRDPVPNPVLSSSQVLAVRKAQELEAVQSALRTKAKHVRYVETRDLTHYELALWNLHKTDAFCGALRLPRRAHATVPGWTEELQSTKSSCEHVRESMLYSTNEELQRLSAWYGHSAWNLHRVGDRPKLGQLTGLVFDRINVVHPSCEGTSVSLTYNHSTQALRIRVAYSREQSMSRDAALRYRPGGPGRDGLHTTCTAATTGPDDSEHAPLLSDDDLADAEFEFEGANFVVTGQAEPGVWTALMIDVEADNGTEIRLSRAELVSNLLRGSAFAIPAS